MSRSVSSSLKKKKCTVLIFYLNSRWRIGTRNRGGPPIFRFNPNGRQNVHPNRKAGCRPVEAREIPGQYARESMTDYMQKKKWANEKLDSQPTGKYARISVHQKKSQDTENAGNTQSNEIDTQNKSAAGSFSDLRNPSVSSEDIPMVPQKKESPLPDIQEISLSGEQLTPIDCSSSNASNQTVILTDSSLNISVESPTPSPKSKTHPASSTPRQNLSTTENKSVKFGDKIQNISKINKNPPEVADLTILDPNLDLDRSEVEEEENFETVQSFGDFKNGSSSEELEVSFKGKPGRKKGSKKFVKMRSRTLTRASNPPERLGFEAPPKSKFNINYY